MEKINLELTLFLAFNSSYVLHSSIHSLISYSGVGAYNTSQSSLHIDFLGISGTKKKHYQNQTVC